jgi:hypothetical protein
MDAGQILDVAMDLGGTIGWLVEFKQLGADSGYLSVLTRLVNICPHMLS